MKTAQTILSVLTEPVLLLDASLRAVLANPAFYSTLQIAPDGLVGKLVQDLFPGELCEPSLHSALAAVLEDDVYLDNFELVCNLPTQVRIVLFVTARQIQMEEEEVEGEMLLVELRNITQQRETERLVQELSDAHAQHGVVLEGINKELEAFTHSVSHDLRTPLRLTNKIAHLLLQDYGPQLPPGAVEKIGIILNSTQEMAKLIEDLLRFSQVSREPLKKRRVDMHRLASEVHDELREERRGRDIEVTIDALPPCQADRSLLKQVFLNLLANALKFTRQREHTEIHVGAMEGDSETIYFVRDNGVGFDMIHADEIFLAFHRVHREYPVEGSGVGLALVKRIIDRHNGRVWAEGLPGKGATIFFCARQTLG